MFFRLVWATLPHRQQVVSSRDDEIRSRPIEDRSNINFVNTLIDSTNFISKWKKISCNVMSRIHYIFNTMSNMENLLQISRLFFKSYNDLILLLGNDIQELELHSYDI